MQKLKNTLDRLPLDNKLVVAIATWLLTFTVTKVGLDLDAVVIPPDYTLAVLISIGAAALAGYFTSNEGTQLRQAADHDGNPEKALVEQHGLVDDAAP